MKKLFVLIAVVGQFVIPEAYAKFVYIETNATEVASNKDGIGYLTDGNWIFGATRTKKTVNLAVSGAKGEFKGSAPCPVDFTTIESEDGSTTYKAVSFNYLSASKAQNSLLYEYREMITEFIAPECKSITGVGSFINCVNLTKVVLNADVTTLHANLFEGCSSLVEFFPRVIGATTLNTGLFSKCSNLEGSFDFPNLGAIPSSLFFSCGKIQEVKAEKATIVGQDSFHSCSSLTNVVLPNLTTIDKQANFRYCTSLTSQALRNILHEGVINITSYCFGGCTSIEELNWNFPDMTSRVVQSSTFGDCSKLSCVKFITPVDEIHGGAFKNIAEGAELYMHLDAPTVYGGDAISRGSAPFPKIILKGNFEAWFEVMGVNNHVITREDFNTRNWSHSYGNDSKGWSVITTLMAKDSAMCKKEKIDGVDTVTVPDKNVIAFVMRGQNSGCWVMRKARDGMRVIVR